MRASGALSCTRLEVSLRTSQKHLANNSAVLTKTQLLDKVSKHLPVTNGAFEIHRAFGVTPMRAPPADYKSAIPACQVQLGAPSRRLLHGGRDAMRGAPSCTRLEVSLRTSQKHLANNSAVLTKTQLPDKVSKHLPVTNGALAIDRASWETSMRASPAKYNLALPAGAYYTAG